MNWRCQSQRFPMAGVHRSRAAGWYGKWDRFRFHEEPRSDRLRNAPQLQSLARCADRLTTIAPARAQCVQTSSALRRWEYAPGSSPPILAAALIPSLRKWVPTEKVYSALARSRSERE